MAFQVEQPVVWPAGDDFVIAYPGMGTLDFASQSSDMILAAFNGFAKLFELVGGSASAVDISYENGSVYYDDVIEWNYQGVSYIIRARTMDPGYTDGGLGQWLDVTIGSTTKRILTMAGEYDPVHHGSISVANDVRGTRFCIVGQYGGFINAGQDVIRIQFDEMRHTHAVGIPTGLQAATLSFKFPAVNVTLTPVPSNVSSSTGSGYFFIEPNPSLTDLYYTIDSINDSLALQQGISTNSFKSYLWNLDYYDTILDHTEDDDPTTGAGTIRVSVSPYLFYEADITVNNVTEHKLAGTQFVTFPNLAAGTYDVDVTLYRFLSDDETDTQRVTVLDDQITAVAFNFDAEDEPGEDSGYSDQDDADQLGRVKFETDLLFTQKLIYVYDAEGVEVQADDGSFQNWTSDKLPYGDYTYKIVFKRWLASDVTSTGSFTIDKALVTVVVDSAEGEESDDPSNWDTLVYAAVGLGILGLLAYLLLNKVL